MDAKPCPKELPRYRRYVNPKLLTSYMLMLSVLTKVSPMPPETLLHRSYSRKADVKANRSRHGRKFHHIMETWKRRLFFGIEDGVLEETKDGVKLAIFGQDGCVVLFT